ncbi:MAG: M23 family metallopeptidase [Patescibacteria group bacterium]
MTRTQAEAKRRNNFISTRITQVFLRTLLRTFSAVVAALRGIGKLIAFILSPLRWLSRTAFFVVLRPVYRLYRIGRTHLNRILAPAKSRWVFFVLHRNTVTIAVSVVAALVAMNNVQAQGTDMANFGRQSIFASIFSSDLAEDVEVVEGPATPQKHGTDTIALTPTAPAQRRPVAEQTVDVTQNPERQLALGVGGTAGDDQSEEVRYYIVEGGDTISSIAATFGIGQSTILWENNMSDTDYIKPGQKLTILPVDGVSHTVKKGDTITSIAKKYKADEEKVLAFNRLASGEALSEGEELIVPDGIIDRPNAPAPSAPSTSTRKFAFINIPPAARVSKGARMQWPTPSRRLNQYFKFRHTGIDIDGDVGSPVYAADSGVVESVVYARYGYGYHVVINHGGGRETLYAHNSKIFVKPGQSVKRGQSIAAIGLTGRTTGAHLHFEVIMNGGKRNPLSYL